MKSGTTMRRRTTAIASGAVAVAIASLFACRQIADFRDEPSAARTGTDAGPDAAADPGVACGFGYGTSRCASCVHANCCPESSACATSPKCAPYASCVGACAGDPACRAQCALDSPPAESTEVPALTACLAAQCESECGLTCGGIVNATSYAGVAPDAAAGCQSCILANGCDVAHACGASTECDALRLCIEPCVTPDCSEACRDKHDAGVPLAVAVSSIAGGACTGVCGRGADWTCVGQFGWTRPESAMVTLSIQVEDYINTAKTFAGVDVRVCDRKDVNCTIASSMAHGTTDATGSVVFEIPNPENSIFLGLDGYIQLQSPDIVPWLYYWGFPLSKAAYTLVDSPSSQLGVKVLTPDDANNLFSQAGSTFDPSASTLVAIATDCEFRLAPEVLVATDPPYLTVPETYDLSKSNTSTGMRGLAAFAGLPAGSIDVIATPLALGNKPSSRQMVTIRPGWVTAVTMLPTP